MIRFGLIGNPVDHSLSPEIFNNMFSKENLDAEYQCYRFDHISELPELLYNIPDLVGINVTSPFKREVLEYLDELTPEALEIGAVNTLFVSREKVNDTIKVRLIGHNTDVDGVMDMFDSIDCVALEDLAVNSAIHTTATPVIVLGTGGASQAVCAALERLGLSFLRVSRNSCENAITYDELNAGADHYLSGNSIIIDATPLGMGSLKDEKPDIPYEKIGPETICFDLVYSPAITPFLYECAGRGAMVRNGLAMLIGQARSAWRFWVDRLGVGDEIPALPPFSFQMPPSVRKCGCGRGSL